MIRKRSVNNAEHYTWGSDSEGWHLLKSDPLSLIEERMPPGASETLHYHERAQQVFYILSGKATFEINWQRQELGAGESIHIAPGILHRVFNDHSEDLRLLLASAPKAHGDRIEIIDYSEEYKEPIKTLNYEWLQKYFHIEPSDVVSLGDPKTHILDQGGFIYYARWNNEIVGTVSLLRKSDTVFELGKMAVTEKAQGHSIGNTLIEFCFHTARQKGIRKLVLYSNTSLGPALHLYKKYGFVEAEPEKGHYERANIKMEKVI